MADIETIMPHDWVVIIPCEHSSLRITPYINCTFQVRYRTKSGFYVLYNNSYLWNNYELRKIAKEAIDIVNI